MRGYPRGILLLFFVVVENVCAFGRMARLDMLGGLDAQAMPSKVLVTGAGGRTGKLVFDLLMNDPRFDPMALVRSEKSAKKLIKGSTCSLGQVIVCDVTQLDTTDEKGFPGGLSDTEAMVICTSAVPSLSKKSLIKALLKVPINIFQGKKALDFRSLRFKFKKGQYPEKVDFEGQKAQIDLAKKVGMKQVVVVSSMGGTDPKNFLNSVGKKPDGSGNGDILLWKRKAEKYLVDSGLNYSIIHPGGLIDTPPSEENFVLDVDDKLLDNKKRSISRADVAALCLASLAVGKGKKVSFDCITRPAEEGETANTPEEALTEFLKEGKTADYSSKVGKTTDMSI